MVDNERNIKVLKYSAFESFTSILTLLMDLNSL